MNLDGLTMSVLARELNENLQNGQIQKLYQVDKHSLLFKVRSANQDVNLMITVGANPAIYICKPIQDLPKEPSSLCMFLRKHIEGSRITSVEQINGDRILCIHIDKLEMDGSITSTAIYIELMGKYSNCIFVQNDMILESIIHVSPLMNRERSVGPKMTYELPPNSNRVSLLDFNEEEIKNLLTTFGSGTVTNTIRSVFNGFGKALLDYVLTIANIDGPEELNTLSDDTVHRLSEALHNLKEKLLKASQLYVYKNVNGKKIYMPFPLETDSTLIETYPTISKAIEQSIVSTGSIHTADKELDPML